MEKFIIKSFRVICNIGVVIGFIAVFIFGIFAGGQDSLFNPFLALLGWAGGFMAIILIFGSMYILFNIANNAQKIADKISAQNAANSNGSVE
ncbi:MAG: hypothetical protein LBH29_03635, partial [Elusimicrobiota bacterium]|nr:hypothetical protein [Elusimicrobiota bacterium]